MIDLNTAPTLTLPIMSSNLHKDYPWYKWWVRFMVGICLAVVLLLLVAREWADTRIPFFQDLIGLLPLVVLLTIGMFRGWLYKRIGEIALYQEGLIITIRKESESLEWKDLSEVIIENEETGVIPIIIQGKKIPVNITMWQLDAFKSILKAKGINVSSTKWRKSNSNSFTDVTQEARN